MSGKWKMRSNPPEVLIQKESANKARMVGYRPIPYYYPDGNTKGIMSMVLKTGCITYEDCEVWHDKNNIPFKKDRKSTRLNSSHVAISYAVFCLTKQK